MPTTIDPSTGETLREYAFFDDDQTERGVALAHERYASWRRRPMAS